MAGYPTGVENHGGNLRVWFIYRGVRVRESLGVPDTPKNRKMAGELRSSVCYEIKTGTFDYSRRFPQSVNLERFGISQSNLTFGELADKWLRLKALTLTINAHTRYVSSMNVMRIIIGEQTLVSRINNETVLNCRVELLTGYHKQREDQTPRAPKKGRSVPTVNFSIACMNEMLSFAQSNGYIKTNPAASVKPMKKSRPEPDPITQEEYARLMQVDCHVQIKNIWTLALYTGMRHGEIISLAWEDIDITAWTLKVTRNLSVADHFTPPKTEAGVRTIHLTKPAIDALKNQMLTTRMGKQHEVDVHLREKGKTRKDLCTFVFLPKLSPGASTAGDWYQKGSLWNTWKALVRRAGIRYRKPYESRHTYACWALSAGANPLFVAEQMGHASAQMIFNVYGKWMSDKNKDQIAILNANLVVNAPSVPQGRTG
nr:site-specific integrase [Pantoea sp. 201603H]